ncbi:hypothetical protein NE237_004994 [Protea cynaroides]|uniref:Trafficking protein particle complex subunit n=1 Tax=Protea cynaroides TaxID=273540 RepID=A0A9Q0QU43_9MAGN|nr:hypothetical protein NE237_004994 [Protea cynaroides]
MSISGGTEDLFIHTIAKTKKALAFIATASFLRFLIVLSMAAIYSLFIINKSGGLIFYKDYGSAARMDTNDSLRLASLWHSMHAISQQLSPTVGCSGIKLLEADTFDLHCFQSLTGTKFCVVCEPGMQQMEGLLNLIYELYTDYVLKNPFYEMEMPIRYIFPHVFIFKVLRLELFQSLAIKINFFGGSCIGFSWHWLLQIIPPDNPTQIVMTMIHDAFQGRSSGEPDIHLKGQFDSALVPNEILGNSQLESQYKDIESFLLDCPAIKVHWTVDEKMVE